MIRSLKQTVILVVLSFVTKVHDLSMTFDFKERHSIIKSTPVSSTWTVINTFHRQEQRHFHENYHFLAHVVVWHRVTFNLFVACLRCTLFWSMSDFGLFTCPSCNPFIGVFARNILKLAFFFVVTKGQLFSVSWFSSFVFQSLSSVLSAKLLFRKQFMISFENRSQTEVCQSCYFHCFVSSLLDMLL